ncbi:MAG: hypothetical protein U9O55_00820, partial [Patescibacteria group bacterium]|nr:hypothetical protein [Patescibacteria group bacterium]
MNEKIPQIIKKNVEAEQETNKKAEQIKHHSEIILDEFIENIDEALPDNNHPEDLEIVKEAQMLADDIDNNYGDIEKMEESKKELSKLLYYLTNKEITTNIADRIDNFKSEFEKDEISKKKEKEENKKEANNSLENEYKKNINHIISEIQNLIFELKQENLIDEIEEKKYKKELNNIKKIKTEKQANCIKKLNKLKDIKDNLIFTKQKIEEKEEMNKINKLDKSLDVQDKVKRLPVYMEMEKLYEEIKKNIFTLEQNKKEEYY